MKKELDKKTVAALLSIFVIWGSTNLAIKITLETMPPFFMAGVRFLLAGAVLYVVLRAFNAPAPSRKEWIAGSVLGALLLIGGNGGVVFAQQWVSSGAAALNIATVPLLVAVFGSIWKERPTKVEWAGMTAGFLGVILLNIDNDMMAHPAGAIALLVSTVCWSFGSAWSKELRLPAGLMAAAVEMLAGGAGLLVLSAVTGERFDAEVTARSAGAFLYLTVFGSLVGFSAYNHLIRNVRYSIATSNAYVNPVIAVCLGVWLAGEKISALGAAAMLIIIASVATVILWRGKNGA